jgi:hypothetical protein
MAVNKTDFMVADATREPTPIIWGDCPVGAIAEDPAVGWHFYDDFADFPLAPTETTQIGAGKYKVYATSTGLVAPVQTFHSIILGNAGVMGFQFAADNNGLSLAQAYPRAYITGSKADGGKLWFECQIAVSTIATNTIGYFVGLAETDKWTLSGTVPFNAASASLNNSAAAIGFFSDEAGLGVIQSAVSDRATSFTAIDATLGQHVAFTYVKLGMIYDPDRQSDCVRFFVNGVQDSSYYSNAQVVATTNLKANALGMIAAFIGAASVSTGIAVMRWWRIAQLYP